MWWSTPRAVCWGRSALFAKSGGYKIKVFNSIDFSKSMHYNPLAYIKTEADILKFVNALISNTKGEGQGGRSVLDEGGNAFCTAPCWATSFLREPRRIAT